MQRRDDPHLVVSNVELFDDRHRVKQAPGVYEERMEGGRCRRDSQYSLARFLVGESSDARRRFERAGGASEARERIVARETG